MVNNHMGQYPKTENYVAEFSKVIIYAKPAVEKKKTRLEVNWKFNALGNFFFATWSGA